MIFFELRVNVLVLWPFWPLARSKMEERVKDLRVADMARPKARVDNTDLIDCDLS